MNIVEVFGKLNDGFFRKAALREARARVVPAGQVRTRALAQATLLLEVARRTADPIEALPGGCRPPVLLGLYREAVYWGLVAARPEAGDPPPDLATLWAEVPPEILPDVARDSATRAALQGPLLASSMGPATLEATDEEVARVRELAEALVAGLEAPQHRAGEILVQRWLRFGVIAVVAVLAGVGVRAATRSPNLVAGRPLRTSSSWAGCAADPPCLAMLFHTDRERNPWVEFDLGAPKTFHRIEVANRTDCCSERAIPLIAEVSNDRVTWTEVARREAEFTNWTTKFAPVTARYVRLRVPRETVLHFRDVAVR